VNQKFQLGTHPDADQLSVFVEGASSSREHERMLTHLAECAECRKAVFLMQPQEETRPATRTPARGWIWGRLLPVGLPAAALACGLVALLLYIRPHGETPEIPQQSASLRQPDIQLPQTTVAPTTDSERVQRSGTQKRSFAPASNLSKQENLNLPKSSGQAAARVAGPETTTANLPANVPVAQAGGSAGGVIGGISSELPLNGRNFSNLQQLSTPADTKAAASQNSLAKKKDLPALQIGRASSQDSTLAEVSGHITDRSGAIVAGVTVMLRDASGTTRQTTTSTDGSFHLTELPAGQYELIATASGFRTSKQSIQLNPSQLTMMEPVLDIGKASEAVEVASAAAPVQTESANVSQVITGQVVAEMPNVGRAVGIPSGLPVTATVSHGKRFISLDDAGNLFLSRNGGKKWKKINPQWAGKAVRIELTPAYSSEAPLRPKNETLGKASEVAVFQLTTDAGAVWTSKDGAHWHQQ
jgi:Carboxypeptidase regulatory-like domain